MITDYTAMLSMGRAKVLLHDGATVERDIIYDKYCAAAIQGKRTEFSYERIYRNGDGWKAGGLEDKYSNDRDMSRLFINRFLQSFPSSHGRTRLQALIHFGNSSLRHLSGAWSRIDRLDASLAGLRNKYKIFGYRDHAGKYNAPHYTIRKDRFNQRQRDHRRLNDKRNVSLMTIVQSLVSTYSGNCADFSQGSSASPSDYNRGWTLRFSDMKIVAYGERGEVKREVDISSLDLASPSFVALSGIRNVFCANIVEETGDTICLQAFGKNSKPKGYVCADKNSKGHILSHKDPSRWIHLSKYGLNDIGATKAEAYARMLAKS